MLGEPITQDTQGDAGYKYIRLALPSPYGVQQLCIRKDVYDNLTKNGCVCLRDRSGLTENLREAFGDETLSKLSGMGVTHRVIALAIILESAMDYTKKIVNIGRMVGGRSPIPEEIQRNY